jgi:hypothetical protein
MGVLQPRRRWTLRRQAQADNAFAENYRFAEESPAGQQLLATEAV